MTTFEYISIWQTKLYNKYKIVSSKEFNLPVTKLKDNVNNSRHCVDNGLALILGLSGAYLGDNRVGCSNLSDVDIDNIGNNFCNECFSQDW